MFRIKKEGDKPKNDPYDASTTSVNFDAEILLNSLKEDDSKAVTLDKQILRTIITELVILQKCVSPIDDKKISFIQFLTTDEVCRSIADMIRNLADHGFKDVDVDEALYDFADVIEGMAGPFDESKFKN